MTNPYGGFVGSIWDEYPQLMEWHNFDDSTLPKWNLDGFVEAGYHNFVASRKPLYHLSKLIEEYATNNGTPLLATFEKIARYKFVEKRYQEMIKKIPKIWIVADYGTNEPKTTENIQLYNCRGTELADVWAVITRGPFGPFGLIAEEYEKDVFRGFFTLNHSVCSTVIDNIGKIIKTKISLQ